MNTELRRRWREQTQYHARMVAAGLSLMHKGPFKTYGKQAFTPEVKVQVLKNGKLVNID